MLKRMRKLIAVIIILSMIIPNQVPAVFAKKVTNDATVFIKTTSNAYLYAEGSDVKSGELKRKIQIIFGKLSKNPMERIGFKTWGQALICVLSMQTVPYD